MALLKLIVGFATVSLASSSCTHGNCDVDDHTNLMQFMQTVTAGGERQDPELTEVDSEQEETVFEKFMMEETDEEVAALPAGCLDQGCVGTGPHCGGNELDCTAHGLVVGGYYKTCGWDTCQTGWKARCFSCPASAKAKPAPFPKPAPGPSLYTAPAPGPTEAPAPTPAPGKAPVMPTNAPIYTAPAYDEYAVGNATLALKKAQATLAALKKNLSLAEATEEKVKHNISKYALEEEHAQSKFETNRDAAVRYGKKRELANITVFKTQVAMNHAYFAQKGAEEHANEWATKAKNYNAHKRFYEKLLVDKRHATKIAFRNLELAGASVFKANSDIDYAKELHYDHTEHEHDMNQLKLHAAEDGTKYAEHLSLKHAQEDAFIASSAGRNVNNTPPWGGHEPFP